MTAFRAAFKAYRMHQVLIMPRFARLTIALGLATAVFPGFSWYLTEPADSNLSLRNNRL